MADLDFNNDDHNRVIIHVDMDYFYAQVEEIHNPYLKTKPLGIQQKNILVTCNYIARKYGIKKLMLIRDAKEKCPSLVLRNGEDLSPYRLMSNKIFEILQKFTPLVEKLGLDENYLDVTEIVNKEIQNQTKDKIREIKGFIHPSELELENCDCGCLQRLTIGSQIALDIRNELQKVLGITCSAGIAHNKILAKLIGNMNKPNNQTVLLPSAAAAFMRELNDLQKIIGIGPKTCSILKENGIKNITDLQLCDLNTINKKLGNDLAHRLKELAFGRDCMVVRQSGKPKTIGIEDSCNSISVRKDVEERFRLLLMRLVNQVSEDGRIPIAIKVMLRKFDAKKKTSHRETKQANIMPSLFKIVHDGQIMLVDGGQDSLLKIIMRLFERVVDMKKPFNITLLGLAFSKFQERKCGPSSIANFLIKKNELEVQSVMSLKSEGASNDNEPGDNYYRRRTTASPVSVKMDVEPISDISDISDPEIEPTSKKTRFGVLISKRKYSPINEIASPSKLRVAELRLNSRESERDFNISSLSTTSTITNTDTITAFTTTTSMNEKNIINMDVTTDIKDDNNYSKIEPDEIFKTTIKGNLANIPCPTGVDPETFQELPSEVQNELIVSWRNSITNRTNYKNPTTNSSNGKGGNTLHRYFIKNN